VVQPGESLWSIAEDVAGDASLWPVLFRANRDQIGDPGVLHPGQRLTIPELEAAADEAPRDDDPPSR
jgi:nucleoid-associated protein YgaU